jgi:SAM-dependent methyltransferase
MKNWLHRKRRDLEDILTRRDLSHTVSPARYRLHRALIPLIEQHAHGRALDAGAGRSPFKSRLEQHVERLVSIDIEDRSGTLDQAADIQHMPEIDSAAYDFVFCSQVLEHVQRPWEAIGELARVLRPGGCLVLSTPHLSWIHEAPHDYYRYTRYGLQSLCEEAGLGVIDVRPTGGLISFLAHPLSLGLLCSLGALPLLRWPVWLVNYLLLVRLLSLLDRLIGLPSLYPCDLVLVAERSAEAPS